MNRRIGVATINDGGGTVDDSEPNYVLDRVVRSRSGKHDLYVVPPLFTVHSDSSAFSALQVPFGSSPVNRWFGESETDLPVYRVSGTHWFITFDESLGSVDVTLNAGDLSPNALASTEEILVGSNPDRTVITDLSTGVPHFAQVYARTELGFSPPSDSVSAVPSGRPEKLRSVATGHALQQNEVQSVVIAATHQNEVQAVTTSAIAIPEVQEITLGNC